MVLDARPQEALTPEHPGARNATALPEQAPPVPSLPGGPTPNNQSSVPVSWGGSGGVGGDSETTADVESGPTVSAPEIWRRVQGLGLGDKPPPQTPHPKLRAPREEHPNAVEPQPTGHTGRGGGRLPHAMALPAESWVPLSRPCEPGQPWPWHTGRGGAQALGVPCLLPGSVDMACAWNLAATVRGSPSGQGQRRHELPSGARQACGPCVASCLARPALMKHISQACSKETGGAEPTAPVTVTQVPANFLVPDSQGCLSHKA